MIPGQIGRSDQRGLIRPCNSFRVRRGKLIGKSPSTVAESEWQTPHASIRIRRWPGPGSRSGLLTSENCPVFETSIALYVPLISPPFDSCSPSFMAAVDSVVARTPDDDD